MISTHILDTARGEVAAGVAVTLDWKKEAHSEWQVLSQDATNADGRIAFKNAIEKGYYRLRFDTKNYFASRKEEVFFLNPEIAFEVKETQRKYHIPLLLTPFAYSTYRGS